MWNSKVSIFWFRRDLRVEDNLALYHSLKSNYPVVPIFIFDESIISELDANDARVSFIYQQLSAININLRRFGSSIRIVKNTVIASWVELLMEYDVKEIYYNEDYEPYSIKRDKKISTFLELKGIKINTYTDHIVFKPDLILKDNMSPYTVFTPYKKKWLKRFKLEKFRVLSDPNYKNFVQGDFVFPSSKDLGIVLSHLVVKDYDLSDLDNYDRNRDFPCLNATTLLGPHLRFGTISIRSIFNKLKQADEVFLSELIWREFFIQIMFHFPRVVNENFKKKYNGIVWRNNEKEFELWCEGKTGYPLVDAGMRQLNKTGYMHNRVRMITASFLCKHLLIDWRWGEAYFAEKLLDFELASNNGNWQWVSGTGCDSAPYFRVFSPSAQTLKFDTDLQYVKKWVPEFNDINYKPIVDHKMARERALHAYKTGLENIIT
jgi:deoxyribodipyrimidine photo-lyase